MTPKNVDTQKQTWYTHIATKSNYSNKKHKYRNMNKKNLPWYISIDNLYLNKYKCLLLRL